MGKSPGNFSSPTWYSRRKRYERKKTPCRITAYEKQETEFHLTSSFLDFFSFQDFVKCGSLYIVVFNAFPLSSLFSLSLTSFLPLPPQHHGEWRPFCFRVAASLSKLACLLVSHRVRRDSARPNFLPSTQAKPLPTHSKTWSSPPSGSTPHWPSTLLVPAPTSTRAAHCC